MCPKLCPNCFLHKSCIAGFEAALVRHGATDEEFAAEMEFAERTRGRERARVLAEVRAILQRGGETLQ